MPRLPPAEGARRRRLLACAIYAVTTAVFLVFAAPATLRVHTPWNHFALQASAWLHGRLDLGGPPPAYAGSNDFSQVGGKWFVPFPPLPALLLVPAVALAGSPEAVADGLFFLMLAGVAPAALFLALEKLRQRGRAERSERDSVLIALLFAFGSVFFFSAEQGTVWFAAHVVGTGLAALYLLVALDAERPFVAGLVLGLAFAARTPLLFAAPLFVLELARRTLPAGFAGPWSPSVVTAALDRRRFARGLLWFGLPLATVFALTLAHNAARFGDPFEVGYRYLTVAWHARIEKWGLFSYHYLARNLGVVLTSLPWLGPGGDAGRSFRINGHGLALWVTTPCYFWLLWPKVTRAPHLALALSAAMVALPTLFYQNSGWLQFGYRFSNDYAVFLFALLYVGGRRFGALFCVVAAWAVAINAFGALTFGRDAGADVYVIDGSQRVLYEPD
jgi:hypothetical protein